MLFPRTEDWRNFHTPWFSPSTVMSPVKLCDNSQSVVTPVKFSDGFNNPCYSVRWSPQSQLNQSSPNFCKQTNVAKPSPKKLFRPWVDEDTKKDEDNNINKTLPPNKLSLVASSNLSDQFSLKVQQLAETLTSTSQTDDDHSKTTLELIATNLGKSADGHRCIYCGKIYSRKYGLKIHLRTHTGFKPLKCKICHRPFGDPSNLNKHTRLHAESGAPLFQCHLCGKTLVRKRDLERHLNSRHPEEDEIDVERL